MTNSVSLIVIKLFTLSVLYRVSFCSLCFLRNWSVLFILLNLCLYMCVYPSYPFDVCSVYSDLSYLIVDIGNLCLLSFFFVILPRDLSVLLIISKNRLSFLFHWFFSVVFLFLNLIGFCYLLFLFSWLTCPFSRFLM